MNLNKGCIEIPEDKGIMLKDIVMNLNKGCIEILYQFYKHQYS